MNKALLLVDIQKDYFENGKSQLFEAERAAFQASKLVELFRKEGLPVIHVQHVNISEGATFFVPDTEGVQIHSSVFPNPEEVVIIKNAPNSFYHTDLSDTLNKGKVEHLIICGMMTHMCIDTTVRAAKDYGYKVTLIQDACATKNLMGPEGPIDARTVHNTFIAALNGVFASSMNADDFIKEFKGNQVKG
jgi:nicotinamidase-related amidase